MMMIGKCNRCEHMNLIQFVKHHNSCGIVYTINGNVYEYKKDSMADVPLNPYPTGYGRKIPTRYWIRYENGRFDARARWHRVYVMQYGNAGSAYILVRGKTMFLDSVTESRLEAL